MEEEAVARQTTPADVLLLYLVPMAALHMGMLLPNSRETESQGSWLCRSPFLTTGRRRMWRCPDLPLGRDVQHRIRFLTPSEGEVLLALLQALTEEGELQWVRRYLYH